VLTQQNSMHVESTKKLAMYYNRVGFYLMI
jgi:hypothetical protein